MNLPDIHILLNRNPLPALVPDRVVEALIASDGLTVYASSFDRRDVLQGAAAAHRAGAPIAELRALADNVIVDPNVVALATVTPVGGPRYSTAELLAVEADVVARARRRADSGVAVVPVAALDKALAARPSLSAEQRTMVAQLTRSGAGVDVVVGRAGSGKTFALDAARSAWETAGTPVIGAALAARAAAELQAGAGIPSDTIDRLLIDAERPGPYGGLEAGSVLVIDEAGMVGTRKLARLLNVAQCSNAKVVLVGDPRQLPEIDAGGAFAALTRELPAVELVDNRRQTNSWERAALAELRSGSVPAAVVAYAQAGRITIAPTADAARETMVGDWWQSRRAGDHAAAMYALRRSDVDDLNARARHQMRTEGLLGTDTVEVGGREFAAGDDIIFLRNDRRLGVKNGGTGIVTAVDQKAATITVDHGGDDPATVIPTEYLEAGHVAYGYATTIHKSQGATVDRAFLLGSDTLYREAGYTGLSRARDGTNLYLVAPPLPKDLGRDDMADPVMELAGRLGVSRAQLLATDQLPPDTTPPRPRPIKDLAVDAQRLAATLTADRHPGDGQDGRGWLNDHRCDLDRWRQLEAAITQQRHALAAAALADPPAHLIETLGRPATAGPDRQEWAQAAGRIEAYRATHDNTDTHDMLGPPPRTTRRPHPMAPRQSRHRQLPAPQPRPRAIPVTVQPSPTAPDKPEKPGSGSEGPSLKPTHRSQGQSCPSPSPGRRTSSTSSTPVALARSAPTCHRTSRPTQRRQRSGTPRRYEATGRFRVGDKQGRRRPRAVSARRCGRPRGP